MKPALAAVALAILLTLARGADNSPKELPGSMTEAQTVSSAESVVKKFLALPLRPFRRGVAW